MSDRTKGLRQDIAALDVEIKAKERELALLVKQREAMVKLVSEIEGTASAPAAVEPVKTTAPVAKTQKPAKKAAKKTSKKKTAAKKAAPAAPEKKTPVIKEMSVKALTEPSIQAILKGATSPVEVRTAIGLGEKKAGTWRRLRDAILADKRVKNVGKGNQTSFAPAAKGSL